MTKKKEEEKKRAVSETNRLRAEVFKKVDLGFIFGTKAVENIDSIEWETQTILQQKKLNIPNINIYL